MRYRRAPGAPLDRFVEDLWVCDDQPVPGVERELVLPGTGAVHLVLRLSDAPLCLLEDAGPRVVGHLVAGGPRQRPYVRDVSRPMRAVGARLRPGAAAAVLGASGGALAGRHTSIDTIDPAFASWGERLAAVQGAEEQLALLERLLAARLRPDRAAHPAVAAALAGLAAGRPVGSVVEASGMSHRHLIALFREAVGLAPKAYARVRRFGAALAHPAAPWAEVALATGYADQAHLVREFQALGGLSPGAYRAHRSDGQHVALTSRDRPRRAAAAASARRPPAAP